MEHETKKRLSEILKKLAIKYSINNQELPDSEFKRRVEEAVEKKCD